jgi:hypothetical protein
MRKVSEYSTHLSSINYLRGQKMKSFSSAIILSGIMSIASTVGFSPMVSAHVETDATQPLLHVTSDAMDGTADIELLMDANGNATGLGYHTSKDVALQFSLADLANKAVFYKDSGYEILMVQTGRFDAASGGEVNMIYKVNAVLGNTRTFSMELVRTGNGWTFQTNDQAGRRPFTQLFLKGNTFFGKKIGLKDVYPIFN